MPTYRHQYATRLNSFRTSSDPRDSMRAAATVPGITAVEINFPEHITESSADAFLGEARTLGLKVTALNLRYDPATYHLGAFTNPNAKLRAQAIAETCAAAD
ncbi:MAG TPA: hypothetical protein PK819_10120, partial [Thermomicrobiales bacterium]|nr:hypothetical protein [Thermomicrobiales bacterium]